MKSICLLLFLFAFATVQAQNNPKSPRESVSAKTKDGVTIFIRYSRPSVRGRAIGKELEPLPGKVWRTGADSATFFEVSKDVKVEGKKLAAGKYGLFTILENGEWTVIFNKTWNQWGAFNYKEADDVLRIKVKDDKSKNFTEKLTFTINDKGEVDLNWGEHELEFDVKS
jgi:VCBS repeat-containing protein